VSLGWVEGVYLGLHTPLPSLFPWTGGGCGGVGAGGAGRVDPIPRSIGFVDRSKGDLHPTDLGFERETGPFRTRPCRIERDRVGGGGAHAATMADTEGAYVGRRIATFWEDEQEWFVGTLVHFDAGSFYEYHVQYDDGDEEGISFREKELASRGKVLTEPGDDEVHGVRKFKWIDQGHGGAKKKDPERVGEAAKRSTGGREGHAASNAKAEREEKATKKRKKREETGEMEEETVHVDGQDEEQTRPNSKKKKKKKKKPKETYAEATDHVDESRRERVQDERERERTDAVASHLERDGPAPWLVLKPNHGGEGTDFSAPELGGKPVDLKKLYQMVQTRGGCQAVTQQKKWKEVEELLAGPGKINQPSIQAQRIYAEWLERYEERQKGPITAPTDEANGIGQHKGNEDDPGKRAGLDVERIDSRKVNERIERTRPVKESKRNKKASEREVGKTKNKGVFKSTGENRIRDNAVAEDSAVVEPIKRTKKRDASPTMRAGSVRTSPRSDGESDRQPSSSSPEWKTVVPKKKSKKEHGSMQPDTQGNTAARKDALFTPATETGKSAKVSKIKKPVRPAQKDGDVSSRKANPPGLDSHKKVSEVVTDKAQAVAPSARIKKPAFSLGNVLKNLEGDGPEKERKPMQSEPKVDEKQKASILYEFLGRLANLSDREQESLMETAQFMVDNANGGMAGKLVENFTQHIETEKKFQQKNTLMYLMDSVLQKAWSKKDNKSITVANLLSEGFSKNLSRIVDAAAPPGRETRENRATLHRFLTTWKDRNYLNHSSIEKGIATVFELIRADKNALSFNPNREQRSLDYHKGLVNPTAGNVEGADRNLLAGIDGYGSVFSMQGLNGLGLKTPSVDFSSMITEEQDGIRTDAQVTFPDNDDAAPSSSQLQPNREAQVVDLPLNGAGKMQGSVSTGKPADSETCHQAPISSKRNIGSRFPKREASPSTEKFKPSQERFEAGGSISSAVTPQERHATDPEARIRSQATAAVFNSDEQSGLNRRPGTGYLPREAARPTGSEGLPKFSPTSRSRDEDSRGPPMYRVPHHAHGVSRGIPKLYTIGDIDEERRRRYFSDVGRSTGYDRRRLDRQGPTADQRASRWEVPSGRMTAGISRHPREMHSNTQDR